jgi:hypothetical protein
MSEIKTNIGGSVKKEETLCMVCKKPTKHNYTLFRGDFLCEICYLSKLPQVEKLERVKQITINCMIFNILKKSESQFIIECDENKKSGGDAHLILGGGFTSLIECEDFIAEFLRTPIRSVF